MTRNVKASGEADRKIGTKIRAHRILIGMTQDQLAKGLGVTFQQVQKYEKGTNRVSASRLQDIARLFDVPTEFFLESGPDGRGAMPQFDFGREALTLVQDFQAIGDATIRRRIAALVRVLARSEPGESEAPEDVEKRNPAPSSAALDGTERTSRRQPSLASGR